MSYNFNSSVSGTGAAVMAAFTKNLAVRVHVTAYGLGANVHDAGLTPQISRFGWVALGQEYSPTYVNWWKWIDFESEITSLPDEIYGSDHVLWSLYPGCVAQLTVEF